MDLNLTDRIRERAYLLWLASGCRDGNAEQHWLTAERDVLQSPKALPEPFKAVPPAKRTVAKKAGRPLGRAASKAVNPLVN